MQTRVQLSTRRRSKDAAWVNMRDESADREVAEITKNMDVKKDFVPLRRPLRHPSPTVARRGQGQQAAEAAARSRHRPFSPNTSVSSISGHRPPPMLPGKAEGGRTSSVRHGALVKVDDHELSVSSICPGHQQDVPSYGNIVAAVRPVPRIGERMKLAKERYASSHNSSFVAAEDQHRYSGLLNDQVIQLPIRN